MKGNRFTLVGRAVARIRFQPGLQRPAGIANKRQVWCSISAITLLLSACQSEDLMAPGQQTSSSLQAEFAQMPRPDLSHLTEDVSAQLEQRRQAVADKLKGVAVFAGVVPETTVLCESHHAHQLYPSAGWCYRWLEQHHQGRTPASYLLAYLHAEQGEFDRALEQLDDWLLIHPEDATGRFRRAEWLDNLGQSQEALAQLTSLLDALDIQNPIYLPALALRGSILLRSDQPEQALDDLRAASELHPEMGQVHYLTGQALARLGQRDEARSYLARRGDGMPSPPDPHFTRVKQRTIGIQSYLAEGSNAMRQGRYEAAAALFERARQSDPQNPTAWLNLGAALAQLKRMDQAQATLQQALELELDDINRSRVHFNLGMLLLAQGAIGQARSQVEAATLIDPGNQRAADLLRRIDEGAP